MKGLKNKTDNEILQVVEELVDRKNYYGSFLVDLVEYGEKNGLPDWLTESIMWDELIAAVEEIESAAS